MDVIFEYLTGNTAQSWLVAILFVGACVYAAVTLFKALNRW